MQKDKFVQKPFACIAGLYMWSGPWFFTVYNKVHTCTLMPCVEVLPTGYLTGRLHLTGVLFWAVDHKRVRKGRGEFVIIIGPFTLYFEIDDPRVIFI